MFKSWYIFFVYSFNTHTYWEDELYIDAKSNMLLIAMHDHGVINMNIIIISNVFK